MSDLACLPVVELSPPNSPDTSAPIATQVARAARIAQPLRVSLCRTPLALCTTHGIALVQHDATYPESPQRTKMCGDPSPKPNGIGLRGRAQSLPTHWDRPRCAGAPTTSWETAGILCSCRREIRRKSRALFPCFAKNRLGRTHGSSPPCLRDVILGFDARCQACSNAS